MLSTADPNNSGYRIDQSKLAWRDVNDGKDKGNFFDITLTGADIVKLADPDGFIRGVRFAMDRFAMATGSTNAYINLDFIQINLKTTNAQYNDTNGYYFTTDTGWSPNQQYATDRERYTLSSDALAGFRSRIPGNKFIALDVMFDSLSTKNNLVFAQGIPGQNESFYALQGGFTIAGQPVRTASVYLKEDVNDAYRKTVAYEDMLDGVWYTVIMPIEVGSFVSISDEYKFGVLTYNDGDVNTSEVCTAWLNNLRLQAVGDMKLIGDDGSDMSKFDRYVSPNTTYVTYDNFGGDIGQAYKLNADGYLGFKDSVKGTIKESAYSRMTMEFRLDTFALGVDENGSALYNVLFWNRLNTAIGIGEKYDDGALSAMANARVFDEDGHSVALDSIVAGRWYTVEIFNPKLDWAFLAGIGTDVYFRNMIWYVGEMEASSDTVPDLTTNQIFDVTDFEQDDILLDSNTVNDGSEDWDY